MAAFSVDAGCDFKRSALLLRERAACDVRSARWRERCSPFSRSPPTSSNDEKVNKADLASLSLQFDKPKKEREKQTLSSLSQSLFLFLSLLCITPWPSTRRAPRRRRLPPSAQSAVGSKARRIASRLARYLLSSDIFRRRLVSFTSPSRSPLSLSFVGFHHFKILPVRPAPCALLSLARRWRPRTGQQARALRFDDYSAVLAAPSARRRFRRCRRSPPPPLLPPSGGRTAPRCA